MRFCLFMLALLAMVLPLRAKTVVVRSGEHATFSRLVIDAATETGWRIGRVAEGYGVVAERPGLSLDLSRAFDLMSRRRIASLAFDRPTGRLTIGLACPCHLVVAERANRRLVLDIADGAPAPDSAVEAPLSEKTMATSWSVGPRPAPDRPAVAGATILFRPVIAPVVDQTGRAAISWQTAVPHDPEVGLSTRADTPPPAGVDGVVTESAAAGMSVNPPVGQPPVALVEDASREAAPGWRGAGQHDIIKHDATRHDMARVTQGLLEDIGRAATQGLVETDHALPDISIPRPPPEPGRDMFTRPADVLPKAGRFAFRAETSVDRDALETATPLSESADGAVCPGDDRVAAGDWGDPARSAGEQLAVARDGLVGEFDRPDPEKIATLLKLYLHYGMGAEARQLLAAFAVAPEDAALLFDMAAIEDGDRVAAESRLPRMLTCDGSVALWAFLAVPDDAAARAVSIPGVTRGFSALSPELRLLLGDRVVARLIAIGEPEAARRIRNALARRDGADDRVVGMIDARLLLATDRTDAAEQLLQRLAMGGDDLSVRATALAVAVRIGMGEKVSPPLAETIAALAFERRKSPDAAEYARLEVLARAGAGEFSAGVDAFRRGAAALAATEQAALARAFLGRLVAEAQDALFAEVYFGAGDIRAAAGADPELSLRLARRLADLGFAEAIGPALSGAAGESEEGRLLRARAALMMGDAAQSAKIVSGVAGAEADRLREELTEKGALDLSASPPRADAGTGQPGVAQADNPVAPTLAASRSALDESAALRAKLEQSLSGPAMTRPDRASASGG